MEETKTSIQFECKKCKKKFVVNAVNGTLCSKQQFRSEEKIIFLTYVVCPHCGERHYCQIDNARTIILLNDATRQFVKLSKLLRSGKSIPQKQKDKFKKVRRHLALIRKALMDECTGKTVVEVLTGLVVDNLQFDVVGGLSDDENSVL